MLGVGRGGQPGVVAVRGAAKHPPAARGSFHSQPRRADGPAASGAKVKGGANAPHINPPGAARGRTQRGALFLPGLIPGALRRLAQFPMDFLGVGMRPQGVNGRMGHLDFGNLFAGEIGRLPSEIQSGEAAQSTGLRKHKLNHVPGLTHGLDQKSEPGQRQRAIDELRLVEV